jgi:hypothetical protein
VLDGRGCATSASSQRSPQDLGNVKLDIRYRELYQRSQIIVLDPKPVENDKARGSAVVELLVAKKPRVAL